MCLPIVAGIVSGIGGAYSSLTQRNAAKAQASADDRAAIQQQQEGNYAAARKGEQVQRTLGEARANISANGLALTGTSAEVVNQSAEQGTMDVAAIRWNAATRSDNLHYQAAVERTNAKSYGVAAGLNFLTPALQGVARYQDSTAFG